MVSSSMKAMLPKNENEISADFNEIDASGDGDVILRTLSNFKIFDESGQLVSIESISGNPGRKVFVSGFVVEPLDEQWQQTILDNICSAPLSASDATDQTISRYAKPLNEELIAALEDPTKFDRAALTTGSNIDSYCTKTFKWYESKVVDVKTDSEGKELVKVHFLGWKSRFDEWLDRNDERIAPRGHSLIVVSNAEKLASRMVPWYEHHQIFATASEILNSPIPNRREVPVLITGIEDWCTDWSYPNPNLWLIAESGIWYRLAGVFAPNGIRGNPAYEYAYIFQETYEKFYVTAQVVMTLLDILPVNSRINFSGMAQAITNRTGDEFSEILLLQHSSFIVDQLNNLVPPAEWEERKLSIPNCHFMSQLLKEGTQFVAAGGILGLLTNRSSSSRRKLMAQQYAEAMNWGENLETAPVVTPKSKGKKGSKAASVEVDELEEWADQLAEEFVAPAAASPAVEIAVKREKIKYPIDDDELWKMESRRTGLAKLPWPIPESHQLRCPVEFCDLLLSTWSNIVNFRGVLRIPYLSLDTYETMLLSSDHKIGSLSKELFVAMLSCLLLEKGSMPKAVIANADKSAYAEEDDDVSCINRIVMPEFVSTSPSPSTWPGSPEDERHHLVSLLRLGDTWLEVLRLLIAERQKIVVPDVLDPLGECESILATLMKKPEAASFLEPLDAIIEGLPDYWSVIQSPMDLGTIKQRLESGWYNALALQTADTMGLVAIGLESDDIAADSDTESVGDNMEGSTSVSKVLFPISVGSLIDLFHTELRRWYPAEVLSIAAGSTTPSTTNKEHQQQQQQPDQVTCQFIEFGRGKDVTVDRNSNRLRKPLTVSNHETKRLLSPDELDLLDKEEKKAPTLPLVASSTVTGASASAEVAENEDILAEDSPSVTERPSTNEYSRYRGHDGFMEDVRLVFANSEKYFSINDSSHPHLESARQLAHTFEQQFEKRVRAPINTAKQLAINAALLTSSSSSTTSYLMSPSKGVDSNANIDSNTSSGDSNGLKSPTPANLKAFDESMKNKMKRWEEDIELLGRTDFHALGLSVKLRLLNWLSHEVLATSAAKAHMEKIISDRKLVYARRQPRSSTGGTSATFAAGTAVGMDVVDMDGAGEIPPDQSGEAAVVDNLNVEASLEPLVASSAKKGRPSKGPRKSSGMKVSSSASNIHALGDGEGLAAADDPMDVDKPTTGNAGLAHSSRHSWGFKLLGVSPDDKFLTRLKPLGQDRHYRTYWTFPQDIETSRIFCRDILEFTDGRSSSGAKNSRWIVFRGDRDIDLLMNWLTEKGNRESQLKKAIVAYLEARVNEKDQIATAMPLFLEATAEPQPATKEMLDKDAKTSMDSAERQEEEQQQTQPQPQPPLVEEESGEGLGKRKRKSSAYLQADMAAPVPKASKSSRSSAAVNNSAKGSSSEAKATATTASASAVKLPLLIEDNSDKDIPDTRWLYLANFLSLQYTTQAFAVALVIDVDLAVTGQLGLGVKETDSQVLVTSFKVSESSPHSAAKQAGVRIGDRILFANEKLIRLVSHIQAALKEMSPITADADADADGIPQTQPSTVIRLHVLRRVNAFKTPGMIDAAAKEANIWQAMQLQGSEDEKFLRLTRDEDAADREIVVGEELYDYQRSFGSIKNVLSRTHVQGERNIPSLLLGVLYEIILNTLHPYIVTSDWIQNRSIYWLSSMRKWVDVIHSSGVEEEESSLRTRLPDVEELYSVISLCLLQFEAVLYKRGTCLPANWNDHHQRRKWQIGCRDAKTHAQLSLTLSVLFQSIDWRKYICACYPISKKNGLLSEDVSYVRMGWEVPDENTTVVYFGEGHAESLQHQLEKKKKASEIRAVSGGDIRKSYGSAAATAGVGQNIWGGCNHFGPAEEPLFCKLSNMRFFLGGSPTDISSCEPFMQVDAVVTRFVANLKLPVPQVTSISVAVVVPRYHLSNVFLRIIDIIRQTPESIPFMSPVSKSDFPDYHDKIKQPISLNEIRDKASKRQSYFTMADLARDFELIKTNCLLFCEKDFPDVAEAAVRLYKEFLDLIKFFQPDIEAGLEKDKLAQDNASCDSTSLEQSKKPESYQACHGNWLNQVNNANTMVSSLLHYIKESQSHITSIAEDLGISPSNSGTAQLRSIFDPRFTSSNPYRLYIDYSKYFSACLGATAMFDNVHPFVPAPTVQPAGADATVDPVSSSSAYPGTHFIPRAMVICAPVRPVDGASSFMIDRHRYASVYKSEFSIPAKVRTFSRTQAKKGKPDQQLPIPDDSQRYGVLVESMPSVITCSEQTASLPWRPFKVEWSNSDDGRMFNGTSAIELDDNGIPRKSLIHSKRYESFVNPWEIEYVQHDKI